MGYTIGFFVSDWNFEAIESFTEGIRRFTADHPDVKVMIFNDFGISGSHGEGRGNMDIFALPDAARLDAIMVETDRDWPIERAKMVFGAAKDHGTPIVSLNYPLPGCIYVGTNNYQAMKDITAHVIHEHEARRLAFVRGEAQSLEAAEREKGFTDACLEAGIAGEDLSFYDASWHMKDGIRAGRQILKAGMPLPDAVVCCNDELAVGVSTALQEAGVQIPGDVKITGFDNLDVSYFSDPEITTIERQYIQTAYDGLHALYRYLQGELNNETVYTPHRIERRESCGCVQGISGTTASENIEIEQKYLRMSRHLRRLYGAETELEEAMYKAETPGEIMALFEEVAEGFGCRNVYVVVDTSYLYGDEEETGAQPFSREMALMAVWGKDPHPPMEDPENHIYKIFDRREMLPPSFRVPDPIHIFYPLRSAKECFGYVVVDGSAPLAEFNMLQMILQLFSNCLKNVQRKRVMAGLYRKVSDMYVRDALTGLHNRFGLQSDGDAFCRRLFEEKGRIGFYFLDMDDMKIINDTLGHEKGDEALILVADAIRTIMKTRPCFGMRYGGDEFVLICDPGEQDLEKELTQAVDAHPFPMPLRFSLGSFVTDTYDPGLLQKYIQKADNCMYDVKRVHHAN